ncbi:hypothetical protein VQ056_16415 [Paenibacillus sp. JTLBN-2024]
MIELLKPTRQTVLLRTNPAIKLVLFVALCLVTVLTRNIDFAAYQALTYTVLLFAFGGFPVREDAAVGSAVWFSFRLLFDDDDPVREGDTLWWQWGLFRISEESFTAGCIWDSARLRLRPKGCFLSARRRP